MVILSFDIFLSLNKPYIQYKTVTHYLGKDVAFFCSSLFSCQNCKEFVATEILPNSCSPYNKAFFGDQETSEILGSYSGVAENSSFLGCDVSVCHRQCQAVRYQTT
jgi:hypothetical protein